MRRKTVLSFTLVVLLSTFLLLSMSPVCSNALPVDVIYDSTTYTVFAEGPNGRPYTYYNSGQYLGTVEGNDEAGLIEVIARALLDPTVQIDFYAKVEANDSSSSGDPGTLYVSYFDEDEPGEFKSGTWATYDGWNPSPGWEPGDDPQPATGEDRLDFYTVKGRDYFSLFWVNPSSSAGTWNVERLPANNQGATPAVSHFSGYVGTLTPVPEPATMLLLGTGLVGLVGFRRKLKK